MRIIWSHILETNEAGKLPACRKHGTNRESKDASIRGKYGLWGWTMLSMGASFAPRKIVYVCNFCDEEFDFSVDPALLKQHI